MVKKWTMVERNLSETAVIEIARRTAEMVCPQSSSRDLFKLKEDSALLEVNEVLADHRMLVTTDTLVEGVHFSNEYFLPSDLGHKCASVNISDIAAMGGEPLFFVLSLQIPSSTSIEWVEDFYAGLGGELKKHNIALVGGDTVKSNKLSVTGTIIGRLRNSGQIKNKIQAGDDIWVSGYLGRSLAGLKLLQGKLPTNLTAALTEVCRVAHLRPTSRLRLGKVLVEQNYISSLTDVSDGLAADSWKILSQVDLGFNIKVEDLPIDSELIDVLGLPSIIAGGEEYELLFTAQEIYRSKLLELPSPKFPQISLIGKVQSSPKNSIVLQLPDGKTQLAKDFLQDQRIYSHDRFDGQLNTPNTNV